MKMLQLACAAAAATFLALYASAAAGVEPNDQSGKGDLAAPSPPRCGPGEGRPLFVSKQSADGAWRSETYGALRDGPSLTPLVIGAVLFLPQAGPRGQACAGQGRRLPGRLRQRRGEAQRGRANSSFRLYGRLGQPGGGAGAARRADPARAGGVAGLPPRPATQRGVGLAARGPGVRRLGLCVGRAPQTGPRQTQGLLARVEPGGHDLCAGRLAVGQGAPERSGLCPGAGVREAVPERQRRAGGRRWEVRRRRVLLHPRRRRAKQGRGRRDGSLRPRAAPLLRHDDGRRAAGVAPLRPGGRPSARGGPARKWLVRNFSAAHNPGDFPGDRAVLRDATYYYWTWAASHAFLAVGLAGWRRPADRSPGRSSLPRNSWPASGPTALGSTASPTRRRTIR